MAFNSIAYLLFLTVAVGIHAVIPRSLRMPWLWGMSLFFYAQWNSTYVLLIFFSTLVDYACAMKMSTGLHRKGWLWLSLCSNLGLLFTFKYYGFFSEVATTLCEILGRPFYLPMLEVLLPVGISFYTLQTLSYSIDVYHRRLEPEKNWFRFATYVSFFPQLVAGPIERAGHLLPQLRQAPSFSWVNLVEGGRLVVWGLVKKVVVADRLSAYVEYVYHQAPNPDSDTILVASILANVLIYADFSAYSDIAKGSARMMGYRLRRNFNFPLFSRSMPDFWKRWHQSLHDFFIDYLYTPIGGRRVPWMRWMFNIAVIFLVSGLWHGAAWNFVVWAIFHMLLVMVHVHLAKLWKMMGWPPLRGGLWAVPQILLVHLQRAASMIFFFIADFDKAWLFFTRLFQWTDSGAPLTPFVPFVNILLFLPPMVLMVVEGLHLRRPWHLRLQTMPKPMRWACYQMMLFTILVFGVETDNPFIYFQF